MENFYIYCNREHADSDKEATSFKFERADDLTRPTSSMQVVNARSAKSVFALGPFLDSDEAETVESQAHSVLALYQIRQARYRVNPLEIAEFWKWIEAQIIPIWVHEKTTFSRQLSRRIRMGCRPTASLRRWVHVEGELSDLLGKARS